MKANWKYTDRSRANIFRVNEDNSCESCAVEVIADWIAEGNTPEPADPLPLPVISVTPWQIRKALNLTNVRVSVENYVTTIATQDEKDAWEFATEFREDNPLLIAAATSLNADLHALLTLAQSL